MGELAQRIEHRVAVTGNLCPSVSGERQRLGRVWSKLRVLVPIPKCSPLIRLGLRSGRAWILVDIDRGRDQEAVPEG